MSNTENKNSNVTNKHVVIYFTDFLKGAKKLWWICVVLAMLIGGVRFVSDYRSYVPYYSSSATFTISTQSSQSTLSGISSYSFYYDTSATSQLTETFPYILQSNILQDSIKNDLELNYLPVSLNASSVAGSNFFTLTATGTDPQMVYDVLVSAIDNYPDAARYVVGNIRFDMIETPVVATSPYNRANYISNATEGVVIGVIIGIFAILLYAFMRRTIRTTDDIKRELNLVSMGSVPGVVFKKYTKPEDRNVIFTNERISSDFLEAFRVIRNVFVNTSEDKKVFVVTSTAPGEGKTTTAVNFALSLVPIGKKILVVDADLHHPSILEALRLEKDSEEISFTEKSEHDKAVFSLNKIDKYGIDVMIIEPADEKNPFDCIKSIKKVIDGLRDNYDYIFIDTPPCGLISDAMHISTAADAAIYVVHQDTVRVSKIRSGIDNLLSTDISVFGCILNGTATGVTGYGYGKGYGYGYSYGYGYRYGYGYGYGKKYGYGDKKKKFGLKK